jgi:hypothetical protein
VPHDNGGQHMSGGKSISFAVTEDHVAYSDCGQQASAMIDYIDGVGDLPTMPELIPVLQFLHGLASIHPLAPLILIHRILYPGDSARVIATNIGASKSLVAEAIRLVAKRNSIERIAYGHMYSKARSSGNRNHVKFKGQPTKGKTRKGVYYAD